MKGEFYHEGRLFTFKETLKPVSVQYTKYVYKLEIEGKDKRYTKKHLKKLKEIVELYYLNNE
jgi:hypothetical protein